MPTNQKQLFYSDVIVCIISLCYFVSDCGGDCINFVNTYRTIVVQNESNYISVCAAFCEMAILNMTNSAPKLEPWFVFVKSSAYNDWNGSKAVGQESMTNENVRFSRVTLITGLTTLCVVLGVWWLPAN